MSKSFRPRLDILPPAQQRLWRELAEVPPEFTLYGGTALALHLGHRDSIDFDFFAETEIDATGLYRAVPFLAGSLIVQQQPNTLTCLVDRGGQVKVSFFGLPKLHHIRPPHLAEDTGLKVASLLDLAATKALAVQQRAQAKDYIDIDALLSAGIDLPRILATARLVHGEAFVPTPTLKALSYFGDGDLPTVPDDVRRRLAMAVTDVDPLRLPSLKRTANRTRER